MTLPAAVQQSQAAAAARSAEFFVAKTCGKCGTDFLPTQGCQKYCIHCRADYPAWHNKQLDEKAKAEGKCVQCRKRPLATIALCDVCRKKSAAHMKEKRAELAAENKCRVCERPAREGKSTCESCAADLTDYGRRRILRFRAQGLCKCKRRLKKGHKQCSKCLKHYAGLQRKRAARNKAARQALFAKRKAEGLCRCGRPQAEGYVNCVSCVESRKKSRRKKKNENRKP